jgi:hypothetical protein
MDPAASEATAPAAGSGLKKQPKVRKTTKHLTPDKQKKESEKRVGQRAGMRNCQNTARLDEERRQETHRFLAAQALVKARS